MKEVGSVNARLVGDVASPPVRPLPPPDAEAPLPQDSALLTGSPPPAPPSTAIADSTPPTAGTATVKTPSSPPAPAVIADLSSPDHAAGLQDLLADPRLAAPRSQQNVDLGPGFPLAPEGDETLALHIHDFMSGHLPTVYDFGVKLVLGAVSGVTGQGLGVNIEQLISVERTLYQSLSPGDTGYVGGTVPIFQQLANGQAVYVNLGPKRQSDADHLMREFSDTDPATLQAQGPGTDDLAPVRQVLLNDMAGGKFPVYVSIDGNLGPQPTPTEEIANASVASIADRSNMFGDDFPDTRQFFNYLVTRIDSNYKATDPWLWSTNRPLHDDIAKMKDDLTPPWLQGTTANPDPLGFQPMPKNVQAGYKTLMGLAGGGKPPTMQNLADFADGCVGLDRDLLSGVQTYWMKMLRSLPPDQRQSLFEPLAKAWVTLNMVPPGDANFDLVSPPTAPMIQLVDRKTGNTILERYDRAMAMYEVVDHTLDGLGLDERKQFMSTLMKEVTARQSDLSAREGRIRQRLGSAYQGLDTGALVTGKEDLNNPKVAAGLNQLYQAEHPEQPVHPMTPEYGDLLRHQIMLQWLADRNLQYGDVKFRCADQLQAFQKDPLIVGQYYAENNSAVLGKITDLPPGPSQTITLGQPIAGQKPTNMSLVFEGGGGKGFAYDECLRQVYSNLAKDQGQVSIDSFSGTSAGAITAGLLAAGYSPDQLSQAMATTDFKKFYSDYLWLEGGNDPKVRGVNRTGLFSMQKMYQTLNQLIGQKVNVQGRPILFRDLPFKLKVVSTVMNSNLPDNLKQKLDAGPDGQVVFSNDTTPNMDVCAAICASAAVPAFFNSPQIQILQQDAKDPKKSTVYRMQNMDGGVVNNFPIGLARNPNESQALVMLPTYYQAPATTPGGQPITLSTLDFDEADLPQINAYNDQRYQEFAPHLGSFIQKAAQQGTDRIVLGFNLATPSDQSQPVVQGQTRPQSEALTVLAKSAGLSTMDPDAANKLILGLQGSSKIAWPEQVAVNTLLDKNGTFQTSLLHGPSYHPPTTEAQDISDVLIGVVGANFTAPTQVSGRVFES